MNNFYGFLTNKGKNIFLITLLSTALLFASCINDLFNDDKSSKKQETQTEQTGSEELIPVKINISNKKQIENILQNVKPQKNISQARAASPQNVALKYKILYKKVTDTSQSSCELTDSSAVLQLSKGTWDFTLIAYYNDTSDKEMVVFSGDILNKEITPGNNPLEFTLIEPDSGKGNISITLKLPALTGYVTSVKAQLKTSSLNAIDGYDESEPTINYGNPFVYSLNNVPHGNYFVVFSIETTYSNNSLPANTETSETTVYPVPVRVVTNLTSESEETLTEIRNVCVITYDLGTDGTVSWTAAPSRVYKKYQNVTLPTYEKLAPIDTKIFNGWKDQKGTKVTPTMIIEQNVTLTPDWITTTLYVDSSATSTESDALATTTAVNTLSAAVNKLVTYENRDGDSYQHEWVINVNGTCSGTSDLSSLKITKLKITGDNNTQDILDGSEGTGSVITNEGTYPLFIEKLTIQKGNNSSGGGLNITNSTAYLNNVILINNTASENGGAIALTKSRLFIYGGCQIGQTSSAAVANSDLCSNRAGVSGGGIYADKDSTIYLGYTDADETDETNVTMTAEEDTPSNAISYNYAGSTSGGTSGNSYGGGGIYCLGKLYTWGGTISYNSAAYGGGIYSTILSMKGSTVSNNAATVEGGGIYKKDNTTKAFITSANLNGAISRTKISGNTSGNTSDNTSSYFGGGISFWGELYISDTIISGNKANGKYSQGGGIYVNSDTSSKLFLYGETTIGDDSASSFATESNKSNSAAAGGGIYLCASASAFLNYSSENATAHTGTVNITYNYVKTDFDNQGGGGIYADMNSKLYIAPGTTINYNATNMNGGGIYGKEGTTYMSGGTIYGNNAKYGGGICLSGKDYGSGYIYYGTLYMYGEAKIGTSENLINGSYSNSALYGGGIYLADIYSKAYLGYSGIDEKENLNGGVSYNKTFATTYVGPGGGGIYNIGLLQISSGSISNNISETDGGGVYNLSNIEFSMTGGTIASNKAVNGGGVYNPSDKTFTMTGGTIESNTADGSGGGIYTTNLSMKGSTVSNNAATGEGGGIFINSSSTTKSSITSAEFDGITTPTVISGNTSSSNGGGISFTAGELYISGTTISGNTATSGGGGIFSGSNSKLFLFGTTTIGADEAFSPATSESNSNSATNGGGIYISANSSAYINYSSEDDTAHTGSVKITYNYSTTTTYTEGGGGIYTAENSNLKIARGTTINYNASPKNGGGIFNKGTLDISAATIESNTAANGGSGGGIYTKQSMSLTDTTITNNEASYGGGIFLSGPDPTSTESKIELYIKKATQFISNSGKHGGAVCTYRAIIIIQDQEETKYAYIKPNPDCNDVLLQKDSTISIDSALSASNQYFARITPHSYDKTTKYIGNENDDNQTVPVSSYYSKFLVTPETVTDTTSLTKQVLWETTNTGYITTDNTNTTFVKIPAKTINETVTGSGLFMAGRKLELPSFYICDHEVTQGEYEKYCFYGVTINWDTWTQNETTKVIKGVNYPACFVSWYDAIVYCNLRSIAEGLEPVYSFGDVTDPASWGDKVVPGTTEDVKGRYHGPSPDDTVDPWSEIKQDYKKSGWRLPLEAEWEYAARGANGADGTEDIETYDYSGSNDSTVVAWMGNNAKIGNYSYPHEVKKDGLLPNRLGLYDMSGNVVELCWDWYSDDLSTAPITGPESNTNLKVAAPGGAYQWPRTLKAYTAGEDPLGRSSNPKNARFNNAGFRIVRTIPEQGQ